MKKNINWVLLNDNYALLTTRINKIGKVERDLQGYSDLSELESDLKMFIDTQVGLKRSRGVDYDYAILFRVTEFAEKQIAKAAGGQTHDEET